jgi:hypothetical protein
MQRTPEKLRCEELKLTKVILAAPSEQTSELGVRNERSSLSGGTCSFSNHTARWSDREHALMDGVQAPSQLRR